VKPEPLAMVPEVKATEAVELRPPKSTVPPRSLMLAETPLMPMLRISPVDTLNVPAETTPATVTAPVKARSPV